jgi:hypothetical protein
VRVERQGPRTVPVWEEKNPPTQPVIDELAADLKTLQRP